jgi:hypothetical protein
MAFQYSPIARADFADVLAKRTAGNTRYIAGIILHHTASPSVALWQRYGNEKTVRSIYNGHTANGWSGIGYHLIILPDGTIAEGRPIAQQGAHAAAWNPGTIGVAMIGDFDSEFPSQAQIASTATVLRELGKRFALDLSKDYRPDVREGLAFHRDCSPKTCPGTKITKVMVRGWLTNTTPAPEAEAEPEEKPGVAPWAAEAWAWAQSEALLDGTRPSDPITRQELAVVLKRLQKANTAPK